MRASLIIPDDLMQKVMRISNERSKTRAIVAAMEAFVRLKGRDDIRALRGKVGIDYAWEQEEARELEGQRERELLHVGRKA